MKTILHQILLQSKHDKVQILVIHHDVGRGRIRHLVNCLKSFYGEILPIVSTITWNLTRLIQMNVPEELLIISGKTVTKSKITYQIDRVNIKVGVMAKNTI